MRKIEFQPRLHTKREVLNRTSESGTLAKSFSLITGCNEEATQYLIEEQGPKALLGPAVSSIVKTDAQKRRYKAFTELYHCNYKVDKEKLSDPSVAAGYIREAIGADMNSQEVFVAVYLDTKLRPIKACRISKGTLDQSIVGVRDIFREAVACNARALIVGHNHPSGVTDPSKPDQNITSTIKDSGVILDIPLMDHIIVSGTDRNDNFSFKANGLIQ